MFAWLVCLLSLLLVFLPVPPQISPFDFGEDPINADEMVSVLCTVNKGDLPLNISWLLNGRPVEKVLGVSVSKSNKRTSQLSIESIKAEHSGKYTCVACNSAGTAQHDDFLNVNGIILISLLHDFNPTPLSSFYSF